MEERKLNEKESLKLITQMIENTQQNTEIGGSNHFIIWGITILMVSLTVGTFVLLTGNMLFNIAYFLIPIIGYSWDRTLSRKEKVTTYIDKMVNVTWKVCGVFCIAVPIIITLLSIFASDYLIFRNGSLYTLIPSIEIIIVSLSIAVTGIIINSKSIRTAGFVGLCLSFLTFVSVPYAVPYTFSIWSIACLIIPGIKFKREIKQSY